MKLLKNICFCGLFFFLFNIANVYADDPYLYCKYNEENNSSEYLELYIQFYSSNSSTYDYEFTYSSGAPVLSKVYPNTKQDLITLGMYDSNTDVVSCPVLAQNSAGEIVLWTDNDIKTYYQAVEVECGFSGCKFNNMGTVVSNPASNVQNIALCEQAGVRKALKFIGNLLLVVKIVIPILLIVMGSIDFSKAVISSNSDALPKSIKIFGTRIIAGVAIFFLPTIIRFLFQGIMKNASNYQNCSTCIFTPNECKIETD